MQLPPAPSSWLRLIPVYLAVLLGCGGNGSSGPDDLAGAKPQNFIDNGDGTITDPDRGLMWMRQVAERKMPWVEARDYCADLTFADHENWRLPTQEELVGLYEDLGAAAGGIDRRVPPFDWRDAYNLWSSSRYHSYTSVAHTLFFHNGVAFYNYKRDPNYVLPVRSMTSSP